MPSKSNLLLTYYSLSFCICGKFINLEHNILHFISCAFWKNRDD